MAQEFNPVDEVRKHPGVAAGVVLVLAGMGLATLLLNQRTGPRRIELLKDRFDPRGWMDTRSLRDRVSDLTHGVRGRVDDLGHRVSDLGERAHDRASRFGHETRGHGLGRHEAKGNKRKLRHYKKQARRYAEDAGDFARDHAREGGTVLAVTVLAAALGAIVWENQKKGGALFD